jgi:hypothetical protein
MASPAQADGAMLRQKARIANPESTGVRELYLFIVFSVRT